MRIQTTFKNFCKVLLLATMLAVPLIYPLKFSDTLYNAIRTRFTSPGLYEFWQENIEPSIYFGFSPLVLKESVANAMIMFTFIVYVISQILVEGHKERFGGFFKRHFFVLAFVIFSGLSLIYTPTFYYSLRTWFNIVCFALFFIIVTEEADSPSFLRKSIYLILFVGFIQCLVALMQHLDLTNQVMLKFDDPRNRMGAFIGHNTGLSIFLVPSFFISTGMLLNRQKGFTRLFYTVFLTMLLLVFIAAKSRGVWVALAITTPLLLIFFKKYTGLGFTRGQYSSAAVVVCLVIASQILPTPLRDPEMSFLLRMSHFSPRRLQSETRLRVLVTSAPLINQKPILGHGIGSFQYVYPKAQGEYFMRFPDSILVPTSKRTQRAHNDYLQALIEVGAVGFLLLLGGLYIYIKRGWNTFVQAGSGEPRLFTISLFFSMCAILIQAFYDFPFHIAPLALYFLFFLGIWTSGTRIYGMTGTVKGEAEIPVTASTRAAGVVIVIALLAVLPRILGFNMLYFASDLHNQRATSYTKTYYSVPEAPTRIKVDWLTRAKGDIERAIRLEPLSGLNLFKAAEINYLLGTIASDAYATSLLQDDEQSAKSRMVYCSMADNYFKKALFYAEFALEELRIHSTYYLIGMIHRDMALLAARRGDTAEEKVQNEKSKSALKVSITYTQAYGPALHDLAELMLKEPLPNMKLIMELRRKIARHDPDYFRSQYFNKLTQAEVYGDYERGLQIAKVLAEIQPDNPDILRALFHAYIYVGDLDGAGSLLDLLKRIDPAYPEVYTLYYCYRKDWKEAKKWLDIVLKDKDVGDLSFFMGIEPFLLERLGMEEEAEAKIRQLLKSRKKYLPTIYRLLGEAAIVIFDEQERGVNYLQKVLEFGSPTTPLVLYHVAEYYAELGEYEKALRIIERHKDNTTGRFKKLEQLHEKMRHENEHKP